MKKSIIIAALMCCIVSLAAQQTQNEPEALKSMKAKIQHVERLNCHENNFTLKLDSVTGNEARFLYEYDSRLNCTKEMRYYPTNTSWYLEQSFENTYDEQNRLISVTHYDGIQTNKTEYTYNEQSLIVEAISTYLSGNTWELNTKHTNEYDEAGNLILYIGYNYFDGWIEAAKRVYEYENGLLQNEVYYDFVEDHWQPHYMTDYYYNAQGLCAQVISSIWEGEWYLVYKTEYAYNEQGSCIEMAYYNRTSNDEWSSDGRYVFEYDTAGHLLSMIGFDQYIGSQVYYYDLKTEFLYDDNYNCTAYNVYDNFSGDWQLEDGYEMTYDPSVGIDQIAGLNRFWDAMEIGGPILERVDLGIPVYNKLLKMKFLEGVEEIDLMDFYYSEYNGLDDPTESLLSVWPNPATETVHIEGSEVAEVQVYNAMGQMVKTVQGSNEINVSSLAEGVYLLRVTDAEGKNYTARVAVKK
jgi:YD repeat-containing protein